jgi:hypothetical protein
MSDDLWNDPRSAIPFEEVEDFLARGGGPAREPNLPGLEFSQSDLAKAVKGSKVLMAAPKFSEAVLRDYRGTLKNMDDLQTMVEYAEYKAKSEFRELVEIGFSPEAAIEDMNLQAEIDREQEESLKADQHIEQMEQVYEQATKDAEEALDRFAAEYPHLAQDPSIVQDAMNLLEIGAAQSAEEAFAQVARVVEEADRVTIVQNVPQVGLAGRSPMELEIAGRELFGDGFVVEDASTAEPDMAYVATGVRTPPGDGIPEGVTMEVLDTETPTSDPFRDEYERVQRAAAATFDQAENERAQGAPVDRSRLEIPESSIAEGGLEAIFGTDVPVVES